MKRLFSFVFLFALIFTGCGNVVHKDNIDEIYKDYWEYSLGDYEVNSRLVDDNGNGSGGFVTNKWYEYTFTFKDINNDLRSITLSNYNIKDFNDELLLAAGDYINEDVKKLFYDRSFETVNGIHSDYDRMFCSAERMNESVLLYDSANGLNFRELTMNTLKENNVIIEIHTYIDLDGGIDDYPELQQKLIDDVGFIFESYEKQFSNIRFRFTVKPSDDWYRTDYNLAYNGSDYVWDVKYYGENQ